MTLVGSPGAGRAQVDGRGRVTPTGAGWRVDWWIGADDRWRRAADEMTVRQTLVDGAPVVETAMRVPGGDAVQRVYGADAAGTVVVEIENASPAPFVAAIVVGSAPSGRLRSLAVDGTELRIERNGAMTLPRPPGRWAVGRIAGAVFDQVHTGDADQGAFPASTDRTGHLEGALLFPLAHRATIRFALGPRAALPSLPSAGEVARSWSAQLQRGMRVDLPDPGLTDAVQAARAAVLIAGTDIAALEDWGFDGEAAAAWRLASWRERRRARRRRHRPARWDDVRRGGDDAGAFLLDLRSLLVHEAGDTVDLLNDLPPDWLGRDLEVHDVPTRAAGAVSYAVRWHGERPALLWDCGQATSLRAPGLDPAWSTGERAGEALLAPVPAVVSAVRGGQHVSQQGAGIDRGTKLALFAMALGILVIANDFTALSVAIPDIESDLETDLTTVQWVINGYALVFGVLIVTSGRIADLFGRKRIFLIGAAIFGAFSLLGGFAPNPEWLIACRVGMAIGGSMVWPAVLGIVYSLLPDDKAGLAGGLILGVAGFGNAVGPLIGGGLTEALSWRWVFFLNLPIALFAMLVTFRFVRESTADTTDRRIDYTGVAALSVGLIALLLALDEGTSDGWGDPGIVALFVLSAVLLMAFGLVEHRAGLHALVPRDVIGNRNFASAALAVLLMSAIFFAALLYLPQYMTKVLGYSALGSGAGLLPMMVVFAATSFVAGSLYARLGPKLIVSLGAVALAVGIFLLSLLDADSSYASLVPGMVIVGLGVGLFYSSITTAGVTALDPSRASLAGGIVYMCQIAGGSIGLGLNTAIVASGSTLSEGISTAFKVDAALAVVGLIVSVLFVGGTVDRERLRTLRGHHRAHA